MNNNAFEQSLLQFYSEKQLKKIQSQKIGICGAGGLGSNVAVLLVRSGFKHFEILDKDHIEPSNLNRQHFFSDDLNKSKVTCLKNHLLNINPSCDLTCHQTSWTKENAASFFKNCTVIVEAVDQAETKCDIIEYYQNKTNLLVSGNGMAGFPPPEPLSVKQINNVFIVGDGQSCVKDGHPPLAPRVTMCAAMMAEIILNNALSCP